MNPLELLDRRVASAFYGRFTELRPAQSAAIKPLTDGHNVVLSSCTGSGKTEAVVAPILSRYWNEAARTDSLVILYIAPTKALVNDLEKRLKPILSSLGLHVGIRHGDRDDLASGPKPHLLLTTPESLEVILFRKDDSLINLRAIIVDEVHLLYNTQRGLQLSLLLHRLKKGLTHELQWAALSATIGNLAYVRDFLFGSNADAIFLEYPTHRPIDSKVAKVENEIDFSRIIKKLIGNSPTKLLLFANSRKECDRLAGILSRDESPNLNIFVHYSSLSAEVRVEAERQFAASKVAVCIATSTLELGIDIGDIDAVILWGVPANVESFLQRIGRGNRRQNKTNVFCLIQDNSKNETEDALRFITLIDAARKGELPIREPYDLYGAINQQFLSVIASGGGSFTRVADLCLLVENLPYMDRPSVETILYELANKEYLKPHGFKNQFGADENLFQLQDYRMIYGNFPASSQSVSVSYKTKLLGSVPAVNLLRLRRGNVVSFAGKYWRVRTTSIDGILLEPSDLKTSNVNFSYPGSGPGFDPFLASKMWELLHVKEIDLKSLAVALRERVHLARTQIQNICHLSEIPFIISDEGVRYFTFAGVMTNKAVALISKQTIYKADDISLVAFTPIEWKTIPTDPKEYESVFNVLFEASSEQSIYQTLLPPKFQIQEYLQDWLKDESTRQALVRLATSTAVKVRSTDCELFMSS